MQIGSSIQCLSFQACHVVGTKRYHPVTAVCFQNITAAQAFQVQTACILKQHTGHGKGIVMEVSEKFIQRRSIQLHLCCIFPAAATSFIRCLWPGTAAALSGSFLRLFSAAAPSCSFLCLHAAAARPRFLRLFSAATHPCRLFWLRSCPLPCYKLSGLF